MTNDQAKLQLALWAGARFISEFEEPWTTKQLFSPVKDEDNENKALFKAGKSKHWQRSFLERLMKFELIEKVKINKGHGVGYDTIDKGTLTKILAEELEKEGQTFRWLLFPRDYEPSEQFRSLFFPDDEEEQEPEPQEEDEEVEMSPVEAVMVQLLSVTSELQEQFLELRKEQKVQSEALVDLAGALQNHHKAMATTLSNVLQTASENQRMQQAVLKKVAHTEKLITRLDAKMSLRERLAQMDGRLAFWGKNNEKLAAGLREAVTQEKEMAAGIMLLTELAEKLDGSEEEAGKSEG
jgi:hypothetical protein